MNTQNRSRLERDLLNLSRAFPLQVDDGYAFVLVSGLKLPPGYNRPSTDMLLELPADYPICPPGVGGSYVYLPPALRFHGRRLDDLHEDHLPTFYPAKVGSWAWFCYEYVAWSPHRDDLIKFVEMVRADLTKPKTCWELPWGVRL
ncbi:MAG: E2/UBC family protein [Verrucomicrobiia bacterium]|jgi:hypothetical protein